MRGIFMNILVEFLQTTYFRLNFIRGNSVDAQTELIGQAAELAKASGNHKLYTFAHVEDAAQRELLASQGFSERGTLRSPYKDGDNLVALDRILA